MIVLVDTEDPFVDEDGTIWFVIAQLWQIDPFIFLQRPCRGLAGEMLPVNVAIEELEVEDHREPGEPDPVDKRWGWTGDYSTEVRLFEVPRMISAEDFVGGPQWDETNPQWRAAYSGDIRRAIDALDLVHALFAGTDDEIAVLTSPDGPRRIERARAKVPA